MKINLWYGFKPGQIINVNGMTCRVLSKGPSLAHLPGGRAVAEFTLEVIKDGVSTTSEIEQMLRMENK